MSTDPRESFATLEDSSSGAGLPLHRVLAGNTSAAKNALAALVGVDPSGNLQYLALNASNQLIADTESGNFVCLSDQGEVADGNAALTLVATITLQQLKIYDQISWVVSSRRATLFQIVQIDDAAITAVETILAEIIVGAGDYTDSNEMACLTFTGGAVGDIEIELRAKNFGTLSSMRGSIGVRETQ